MEEDDEWENSSWDEDTEEVEDTTGFDTDTLNNQVEININPDGLKINKRNQHKVTIDKRGISIQKT